MQVQHFKSKVENLDFH